MPANAVALPQIEQQIDITGGSFQVFGVTGVPHLPVNKPPTIDLVTTTLLTQVRNTANCSPEMSRSRPPHCSPRGADCTRGTGRWLAMHNHWHAVHTLSQGSGHEQNPSSLRHPHGVAPEDAAAPYCGQPKKCSARCRSELPLPGSQNTRPSCLSLADHPSHARLRVPELQVRCVGTPGVWGLRTVAGLARSIACVCVRVDHQQCSAHHQSRTVNACGSTPCCCPQALRRHRPRHPVRAGCHCHRPGGRRHLRKGGLAL